MKVLIATHDKFNDYDELRDAVELSGFDIDEIICPGEGYVFGLCKRLCEENEYPMTSFKIDWNKITDIPDGYIDVKTNKRGKYNRLAGKYNSYKLVANSDSLVYIGSATNKDNAFYLSLAMNKEKGKENVYSHKPHIKETSYWYIF